MKTIRQQVEDKCIHFTGLMNTYCKAGVEYNKVKDKSTNPFKLPCIKNNDVFFGSHCDKCQFPTPEQVEEKLKEIDELLNKYLK